MKIYKVPENIRLIPINRTEFHRHRVKILCFLYFGFRIERLFKLEPENITKFLNTDLA